MTGILSRKKTGKAYKTNSKYHNTKAFQNFSLAAITLRHPDINSVNEVRMQDALRYIFGNSRNNIKKKIMVSSVWGLHSMA